MNPIFVLLADGNAFFAGIALALLSESFRKTENRLAGSLSRIAGCIGIALAVASSTPLPLWIYVIWLGCWGLSFFSPRTWKPGRYATILFVFSSFCLMAAEARFRVSPQIPIADQEPIFVLGDSISAGMGTKERVWPLVLGDISHLNVTNLAQPGATVIDAAKQAKEINAAKGLVIIEIGGNDMFGDLPSAEFARRLDSLLGSLSAAGEQIAMFELPLLPFHHGYAIAQRTLAAKYNTFLIPKSCLANVIKQPDDTLDGLHLSQKGHNALAKSVLALLSEAPMSQVR